MKKVQLADRLGNIQTKKVGFSILHFFFGPFHSIFSGYIFTALFELIMYFLLLPIPGMIFILSLIEQIPFITPEVFQWISIVLMFFRSLPVAVFGILIVALVHILISSRIGCRKLRRYMKRKQLRPLEEKDARILIRYRVCDINIGLAESFDIRGTTNYKSAEENWYEKNQTRIANSPTFETRSNLRFTSEQKVSVKIEQLKNIYDLGLISKDEYQRRLKKLKEEK